MVTRSAGAVEVVYKVLKKMIFKRRIKICSMSICTQNLVDVYIHGNIAHNIRTLQVAPFLHGSGTHSLISIPQSRPVYPGSHAQS